MAAGRVRAKEAIAIEQLWTLWSLGFLLGLRHALDADHVVAVSAIVAQTRELRKAAFVGTLWGLGHTLTLSLVGIVVLLGKLAIPEALAHTAEFLVGVVLIFLGLSTLWGLHRQRVHFHEHTHQTEEHAHFHKHVDTPAHKHEHSKLSWRPLLVGMMHGLAGSAALMLLVLGTVRSELLGLLYILLFGVGSVGGMLLVSLLLALPVIWTARSLQWAHRTIVFVAGSASIAFGIWLIIEIGLGL